MKKKALILVSSAAVILAGLGFGGHAWLKGRLQKEALVAQMEEAWNCRAHLDSTTVNLFSSPASVSLHGLKLAPRDAQIGVPLTQRTLMDEGTVALSCEKAVLSVELGDLIARRLHVQQLHLDGVKARIVVDEEGRGSLEKLFESPCEEEKTSGHESATSGGGGGSAPVASTDTPAAADAPASTETTTPAETKEATPKPKKEKKPASEKKPMKADQLLFSLAVKEAGVTNAQVEVTDLKNGTHMLLEQVGFALKDIDVDAGNLAQHNQCRFEFGGHVQLEKPADNVKMANFTVEGSGDVAPFDAKTGVWSPDLNLAVTIKKNGLVGGRLLSQQMSAKDLERMKQYGLDLGDIAIGGLLQEDATTRVHIFGEGKTMVKQDTRLAFPQYEMTLLEKSWFNARQDAHNARARLIVSPELSARILDGAQKSLGEKYGETLAKIAVELVSKTLMDDQKRLVLPFKAKGSMSKPDVQMDNMLNDIKELLKDAGKSFLEGLLKGQ